MPNDSGCLILGTAFKLQVPQVRLFVESLRKHYDGPVMLLITSLDSRDLVIYLCSRDVTPVFFDCPYWMLTHVQVARYVRYGEILRGSDRPYDRILLSDVSDILFQAHPFAGAPPGDLLCFHEHADRMIGKCKANSMWMEQIYGPEVLSRLKDCRISCSGTTIGSHAAILQYIDLLLSYADPKVLAALKGFRGHDQAIHNFLLHTGALPHAQLIPNGRHVLTLGGAPDSEVILGPNGTLLSPEGRLCPIVHHYEARGQAHIAAAFPTAE